MDSKVILERIKPTNHSPQDRFSLNLWRWVRKAIGRNRIRLVVAFATRDGDELKKYDPTKTQASRIYIGYGDIDDGWLHGSRLSEILCNGVKAGGFAYPPKMRFVEIPDWWERYIAGGKCAIDPEHWLYGHERWQESEDGQERTCIWCGNHTQHKHTEMVPRTDWRSGPQPEKEAATA